MVSIQDRQGYTTGGRIWVTGEGWRHVFCPRLVSSTHILTYTLESPLIFMWWIINEGKWNGRRSPLVINWGDCVCALSRRELPVILPSCVKRRWWKVMLRQWQTPGFESFIKLLQTFKLQLVQPSTFCCSCFSWIRSIVLKNGGVGYEGRYYFWVFGTWGEVNNNVSMKYITSWTGLTPSRAVLIFQVTNWKEREEGEEG